MKQLIDLFKIILITFIAATVFIILGEIFATICSLLA